ncbi:ribosomal maturation YjgA family protein [Chryseobacterium hagamense]|uniref:DUF2809 domain-containing protein n=1 Tax=Chryseobacterium hagamense TaxID=395935 RepID=A0A511YKF3_9FLAO|nr:DUF2809 domain-containing protein [Chryseobacterium hagamense]GEN75682.1 hypothetical protein CHA01nite_14220 [Chryseobacterium hagamense]
MRKPAFRFHYQYFLATILIFLTEVLIATVLKDIFFVRAYLGDVIVVMLLYTLIKSFFSIRHDAGLIFGILIFSFLVEFAQYFNIAEKLGFRPGSIMYIMIGNSFSRIDLLCYAIGCFMLLFFVKFAGKQDR